MSAEFTPITNFGNVGILGRYVEVDHVGIDFGRVSQMAAHLGFAEGVKLDLDWPYPVVDGKMQNGGIAISNDVMPTEPAFNLPAAAPGVLWMRLDVRNIYQRLDVFNSSLRGGDTVQFASGLHATLGTALREAYGAHGNERTGRGYFAAQFLTRTQRLAGIIS